MQYCWALNVMATVTMLKVRGLALSLALKHLAISLHEQKRLNPYEFTLLHILLYVFYNSNII